MEYLSLHHKLDHLLERKQKRRIGTSFETNPKGPWCTHVIVNVSIYVAQHCTGAGSMRRGGAAGAGQHAENPTRGNWDKPLSSKLAAAISSDVYRRYTQLRKKVSL